MKGRYNLNDDNGVNEGWYKGTGSRKSRKVKGYRKEDKGEKK